MTAAMDDQAPPSERKSLLFEGTNPFGTFAAVVEDDGSTVYLYLVPTEQRDAPMRALWVAQRRADHFAEAASPSPGRPPRMPEQHVLHPDGLASFDPGNLHVVWLDDGLGLGLFHGSELVALLPSTAQRGTFPGFAREALGRGPWAWSLLDDSAEPWVTALQQARATWSQWQGTATRWPRFRDDALARLHQKIGPHEGYFAGETSRFPPLGFAEFPLGRDGLRLHVTVGMSAFPMPGTRETNREGASALRPEPRDVTEGNSREPEAAMPRVELALVTEGNPAWAHQTLAWLARYPWTYGTFLGDRHVVRAPTAHATWFPPDSSALLLLRSPSGARALGLPSLEDAGSSTDPAYLFVVPITMDEHRAVLAGSMDRIVERVATQRLRTLPV